MVAGTSDEISGRGPAAPIDDSSEEPYDRADEATPTEREDESFENAAPADLAALSPEVESDKPITAAVHDSSPPSLESVVERIPLTTRDLLADLFKASFTAVRKIRSDQLR